MTRLQVLEMSFLDESFESAAQLLREEMNSIGKSIEYAEDSLRATLEVYNEEVRGTDDEDPHFQEKTQRFREYLQKLRDSLQQLQCLSHRE